MSAQPLHQVSEMRRSLFCTKLNFFESCRYPRVACKPTLGHCCHALGTEECFA